MCSNVLLGANVNNPRSNSRRRFVVISYRSGPLPVTLRHATTGNGLAVGLVISISAYVLSWSASNTVAVVCPIVVFFIPAGWILHRHHKTIANDSRASELGWRYALSAGIVGYLAIAFNILTISGDYFAIALLVLLVGTLGLASAVAAATVAFVITWRVIQLMLPKFIFQDGTLCPYCAYCLLGVESMRCPECGSAFAYEDLETTESEFRGRAAAINAK